MANGLSGAEAGSADDRRGGRSRGAGRRGVRADSRGLPAGYFVLPTGYFLADLNQADASPERLLNHEVDIGLVYHGSSVTEGASRKLRRFVDFDGKPG